MNAQHTLSFGLEGEKRLIARSKTRIHSKVFKCREYQNRKYCGSQLRRLQTRGGVECTRSWRMFTMSGDETVIENGWHTAAAVASCCWSPRGPPDSQCVVVYVFVC